MKQSDIISVVMVAAIGTIVAFVMVNMILGEPQDVTYKTVSSVSTDLKEPDSEVFNYSAVNPTDEDIDRDGVLSDKELEACKNEGETPEPEPEPEPEVEPESEVEPEVEPEVEIEE